MPRSGVNGTYTLPPNTDNQQPLTPISSSMFNSAMDDVEQTFNTPTPIAYGGTGASTDVGARAELGVDFYDGTMGLTAAQQGQARANIGADLLGGFRNKIINGDFDIWQRGTSFPAGVGYSADRWNHGSINTGAKSRQSFTTGQTDVPGNPRYFLRVVGGPNTAGNVQQYIEGVATLAGRASTVTFWAKGTAGHQITVTLRQYFGTGGSPSTNVDTSVATISLTTTWTKYSYAVSVPSIGGKTLGTNGNDALMLTFTLGAEGSTLDLAHVSLVEGDATAEADPFSPRHIQQELALCQRYYWATAGTMYGMNYGPAFSYRVTFPVTMRTTPAITKSPSSGTFNSEHITADGWSSYYTGTQTGLLNAFTADAEL